MGSELKARQKGVVALSKSLSASRRKLARNAVQAHGRRRPNGLNNYSYTFSQRPLVQNSDDDDVFSFPNGTGHRGHLLSKKATGCAFPDLRPETFIRVAQARQAPVAMRRGMAQSLFPPLPFAATPLAMRRRCFPSLWSSALTSLVSRPPIA
ncbi:hypothetical protein VTN77DRAFT_7028 [Rasamsonia byssochlamydoides]|uniref:uncharacterized protein n=1 Tax=Rasamsonia byssochlamydoides TaxID=89139 RepID=UPI003741FDDE